MSYTRHDLCNLCHRGMLSAEFAICIKCSASTYFIRYKVRGGAFDPPMQGVTNIYMAMCILTRPQGGWLVW